jgi:hypothetical protein
MQSFINMHQQHSKNKMIRDHNIEINVSHPDLIYPTSKVPQNNSTRSLEQPYVHGKGYDCTRGLYLKGFHSATNS